VVLSVTADAADEADVAVAAFPEMLMPQVPDAPVPVFDGASLAISAFTNAVVATCVVLVPTVAVGAKGVPVKVGDARLALVAYRSSMVCEITDTYTTALPDSDKRLPVLDDRRERDSVVPTLV
jgi:hypothetical protein